MNIFDLTSVPTWTERALCQKYDPEAWFVEGDQSAEPAKRICRRCPVQTKCLEFAMENREEGIWGGLTAEERRQLRKNGDAA